MSNFNLSVMKALTYDTVVVGGEFAGVGAAVASVCSYRVYGKARI